MSVSKSLSQNIASPKPSAVGSSILGRAKVAPVSVSIAAPKKNPVPAPRKTGPGMPSRPTEPRVDKIQQLAKLYFSPDSTPIMGQNYTSIDDLKYAYTFDQRKILITSLTTLINSVSPDSSVVISVDNGRDFILPISLSYIPGVSTIISVIPGDVNSKAYASRKLIVDANLKLAGFTGPVVEDDDIIYSKDGIELLVRDKSASNDSLIVFIDSPDKLDEHFSAQKDKWFFVKSLKVETVPEGYAVENGLLQAFSLVYPDTEANHSLLSEIQFSRTESQGVIRDLSKWQVQIKEQVTNILKGCLNDKLITAIVSDSKYIKLFGQAFTNETVNPEAPYDTLAIVGDKVLDTAMVTYLLEKKPDFNAQEITLLKNKYLSKYVQARIGRELKLDKLALVESNEVGVDVAEDIMESFFGALYMAINHHFGKNGAGMPGCYQLFVKIFEGQIDLQDIKIDPYTELKEIYDRLGWGLVMLGQDDDETYYISAPRKIKSYRGNDELARLSSEIEGNLAETTANSKQAAKVILATNALERLKRLGLTTSKAREIHFNNILRTISRSSKIDSIEAYCEAHDYERVEFYEPKKTQNETGSTTTLQLRGVTKLGTEVVIGSVKGVTKETKVDAQRELVDMIV